MTMQRSLEDAVNKIRESLRDNSRQESRSSFSSMPSQSSMGSMDMGNDLPPLPKAPTFDKIMPKRRGLKLF